MRNTIAFLVAAASLANIARAAPPSLTQHALKPAVDRYLHSRGDFCLGKFEWPIAVNDHDRQIGSNDARQMPALERVGLVTASSDEGDDHVVRYDLTAEGRKYYLAKKRATVASGDKRVEHPGDFCAAKLSLDRVVSWDAPTLVDGHPQTLVRYTYKVAAPEWTRDPRVQQVFPMVQRIVDGAGTQQLVQAFAWSDNAWVAIVPGG